MSTLSVPSEAVSERIQAMRIMAELSLARVQMIASDNANALARVVASYRAILADTGARLIRAQASATIALAAKPGDAGLIAQQRRSIELLTSWAAHAKGYGAYERPATDAEKGGAIEIGVAPVVIIAIAAAGAVIAVSMTGIAWAVVHYKEAQTLSDEVAMIERNPALADALAKVNTTAPSSSPPNPLAAVLPAAAGGGWGWILAALGAAGAAVYFLPKLGKG